MAKNLLLYDKYNKVINTTLDVKGTTGNFAIETGTQGQYISLSGISFYAGN